MRWLKYAIILKMPNNADFRHYAISNFRVLLTYNERQFSAIPFPYPFKKMSQNPPE